jgi:hypothetical protein
VIFDGDAMRMLLARSRALINSSKHFTRQVTEADHAQAILPIILRSYGFWGVWQRARQRWDLPSR